MCEGREAYEAVRLMAQYPSHSPTGRQETSQRAEIVLPSSRGQAWQAWQAWREIGLPRSVSHSTGEERAAINSQPLYSWEGYWPLSVAASGNGGSSARSSAVCLTQYDQTPRFSGRSGICPFSVHPGQLRRRMKRGSNQTFGPRQLCFFRAKPTTKIRQRSNWSLSAIETKRHAPVHSPN